jgi:Acyl-CoA reductase (LuxC)
MLGCVSSLRQRHVRASCTCESLKDALKYVNVATQTVGVYPPSRMPELRDGLASGGAQRVVRLGDAGGQSIGAPHDAMYIMHRFVHWIVHEDGFIQQ